MPKSNQYISYSRSSQLSREGGDEKVILTLVKTVRKILCGNTVMARLRIQEIKLNSKYSKDKWGFTANIQSEGVSGLNIQG